MDEEQNKSHFSERILKAQWVIDSETQIQYLIDSVTGQKLAQKDKNGNWIET